MEAGTRPECGSVGLCLHRWQKVLNPMMVKGPWSRAEDTKLAENVQKFGAKNWSYIARALPGRIGK